MMVRTPPDTPRNLGDRPEFGIPPEDSPQEPPRRPERKHGFECPFSIHQIGAIVAYLFLIFVFYSLEIFILQAIHQHVFLGCSIVASLLFIGIITLTVMATKADPTDPTVKLNRDFRLGK